MHKELKTKAHYQIAKIYDDFSILDTAIEHYFASISYSEEEDNVNRQTMTLSKISAIFADKYQNKEAKSYIELTNEMIDEVDNLKIKTKILNNQALVCEKIGEPHIAVTCYKKAILSLKKKENTEIEIAKNYENASDLMLKLGNKEQAKGFLENALFYSDKITKKEYVAKINKKLAFFS